MTAPGHKVQSECINCHEVRPCFKIELRAPLPEPVIHHAYTDRGEPITTMIEYEDGPMVEICRECLGNERGVVISFLLGSHEGTHAEFTRAESEA